METKKKRTKVVASVLALAGLLWLFSLATAGDLEPNAPPAPTMKTLDEIYDAVIASSSGISEREGYLQHVEVPPAIDPGPSGYVNLFTVPAGKRFVLMKLYFYSGFLSLTVNGNLFIGGGYFYGTLPSASGTYVDFPDRCVVVNAGETLRAVNDASYNTFRATIVGYFYDVP